MKLLSFELPGLSGVDRGCGRVDGACEMEVAVEVGGEGKVGCRKPPGPAGSEADVMVWRVR